MSKIHLSDGEWTVMHAVWVDPPTTARRVLQAVEDETGWKYSTVKTMLDRLVDKGALTAALEGITTVYEAALTREEAQHTAAARLAERAFGGGVGSLMHFLVETERLSAKDRKALAALLEEDAKRRGGSGR